MAENERKSKRGRRNMNPEEPRRQDSDRVSPDRQRDMPERESEKQGPRQ